MTIEQGFLTPSSASRRVIADAPGPGTAPDVQQAVGFLSRAFANAAVHQVAIRLWDGTRWPNDAPRPVTLLLKHPEALWNMFASGTEKGLAEAYVRGDFDVEGDVEAALELVEAMSERKRGSWLAWTLRLRQLALLSRHRTRAGTGMRFRRGVAVRHSLRRDRQAVSFHYDVSNDFYRLWLDPHMLYSCAYFRSAEDDLGQAQIAKLDHLCRKLRLQRGQRVLDIGCGWGGFALFAARHYGVQVTGITLSLRQAELAAQRAKEAGLSGSVAIQLLDYRALADPAGFDAIVSVGMSEHVGTAQLPTYFRKAWSLLKPGGVFLNHAIGQGVRPRRRRGGSFLATYVFPDTEIPPIPTVLGAAETAGFEVRDVENLREHYRLTLRNWVRRLEAAHDQALEHVNEPTYRVWRAYLAGSAYGFAVGHLAIYQALLSKPDAQGRAHLPLTRQDWYR